MGDVAMLQACIARLRRISPNVDISVLVADPSLLASYCAGVTPISVESRDTFFEGYRTTGSRIYEAWRSVRRYLRNHPASAEFSSAFQSADAIVVAGGGFINDINPIQTRPLLRMIIAAARKGRRTALFGQGLGPLQNPELLHLLGKACQHGARIGLREPLHGPLVLQSAGVDNDAWTVTGDDAIEMAFLSRPQALGDALGFSLRFAEYSELQGHDCNVLRKSLLKLRKLLNAESVSIPISFNAWEEDSLAIANILGNDEGNESLALDMPSTLISQAARCRVVVSGTYHGAVFALSQGIPSLCLYRSPYYRYKMEGLAAQFPTGCELLDLSSDDVEDKVVNCVQRLWHAADYLREPLITAAERQVSAGNAFYRSVFS